MPHPDVDRMRAYTERMCADLSFCASLCRSYTVDTVYFGGGTPTLLDSKELCRMLDAVRTHYTLSSDAEITLECNPATGSLDGFRALRAAGFNRVSIGLQSAHENELRALGRIHTFSDFVHTLETLRAAGFENLSADVMQGIPEQTAESYFETLERVASLSPTHVSAYALSMEEGTRFSRIADKLPLPDEEVSRRMYLEGIEYLAAQGYAQYEISNFARAGYESRHNLKYWECEEYLGFGPAAYSFFGGDRFGNARNIEGYIEGEDIECERERITPHEGANEYVMLGMRTARGVSVAAFDARYPQSFRETFAPRLEKYIPMGLVKRTADGYAFTPEGMYVSNGVLSDVLEF